MGKKPASKAKSAPKASSAKKAVVDKATNQARIEVHRLAAMIEALPSLDDTLRAAFRGQFSDDRCRELGATTRAAVVELEAMGMARPAFDFVQGPKGGMVRYAPQRMAWLLECLAALVALRQDDVVTRSKAASQRGGRSLAEESAQRVSGELSLALQDITVGRDDLAQALSEARASVVPTSDTAAMLASLAGLAARWLQSGDALTRALLLGANVTADDVSRAQDAVAALRRERDAAQGAAASKHDSAAVNAIEGRVLFELRLLRKTFLRAADRSGDPAIPSIRVSPGLKRVFSAAGDDAEEPAKPEEPVKPV